MTPVEDRPRSWRPPDFGAMEAVMWRAEADAPRSSTVVAVEELDVAPEWTRFLAAHEWGSRMVPRFRQRPDVRLGLAAWVTDPTFRLRDHVVRIEVPDGTWQDVLDRVAADARDPFHPGRSPWKATLVHGLRGGRAAYVLRMNHAVLEGAGGMRLFGRLHSRQRTPTPDKPQPLPLPVARPAAVVAALHHDAAVLRRAIARLPGTGRSALRPDRTVRDGVRYAASLRRILAPTVAPPSPLLAGRGGDRAFLALDVPLAALHRAACAAAATPNDAYLAAVAGAFARYHEAAGAPIATLPFAIPVAAGPSRDGERRRVARARFAAPLAVRDPVERMHLIGRAVRELRQEPALDALDGVAPVLVRLPGPPLARVVARAASHADVDASSVPAIADEDVFIAGARVLRFYAYGPPSGGAAAVVLVGHGDTGCVTVSHDRAIADPDTFRRCLVQAFDEVLAVGPDGARSELRR